MSPGSTKKFLQSRSCTPLERATRQRDQGKYCEYIQELDREWGNKSSQWTVRPTSTSTSKYCVAPTTKRLQKTSRAPT